MKLKPSLMDSLCYSESIYVSFNLNKLMPLHLWPPLGGIHERKWGKSKEMFTTNKKYTHCKRLACCVALEYCLKDSPCCTEWIDVCYKCIRDLVWSHYMDTCAFINAHEIAPLKTVIEAYLLIKWL